MVWLNLETNIHNQWCVPWNLLHHKTLKSICGVGTGAKAHAQYLFRLFNPGADTDTDESKTLIHDFLRITNAISSDIKKDIKNYVQHTIFRLFTTSCIYLGLPPRPEVSNFANAIKSYVPGCIKAYQIMKFVIHEVKTAFQFDNNKEMLARFLMEHRNMCIIPREPTPVYTFPIRLIHSVCDGISSTFNAKFEAVLGPHCTWEKTFLRSRGIIRKIQSPSSRRVLPRSPSGRTTQCMTLNQSPATSTKQQAQQSVVQLKFAASSDLASPVPSFLPNKVTPENTLTSAPFAAVTTSIQVAATQEAELDKKTIDAEVAAQRLAAEVAAAAYNVAKVAAAQNVVAEQEVAAAALKAATEKKTKDELSEIKCYLADTKWAYIHEGTISERDYMLKIAFDFTPMLNKFTNKWGKDMVPIDLRVAINDFEVNVFETEDVTDWPKLALHDEMMLPHNNTPYKVIDRTM